MNIFKSWQYYTACSHFERENVFMSFMLSLFGKITDFSLIGI